MDSLIWFNLPLLSKYDPALQDRGYQHSSWFNLPGFFTPMRHFHSRVHKLDTPWDLADTVCPLPKEILEEQDYATALDAATEQCVQSILAKDLEPYFAWSGGIDSTCLLAALLRNNNRDFLDRLTILCNGDSVRENAYFYHKFIKGKYRTLDINDQTIDESNYSRVAFMDAHMGDHMFGGANQLLADWSSKGMFSALDANWRSVDIYKVAHSIYSGQPRDVDFFTDLVIESIKYCPVSVATVHDFIWWTRFNYHVHDVMLMHVIPHAARLTPEQTKVLYNNSHRIFATQEMQSWTMVSNNQRRESLRIDPKVIPKQYIYEFDHNDLYYANKTKQTSQVRSSELARWAGLVAIDSNWNKYYLSDRSVRVRLGEILGRA